LKEFRVDVAIIGDGPAACTVALTLVKFGISACLIGSSYHNRVLFGETVHPNIKYPLEYLGLWEDFLNDKHLESPGNLSIWGDGLVRENNFIFHPNSHGWHLDRLKFNLMLVNAVQKAGLYHISSKLPFINKYLNGSFGITLSSRGYERSELIVTDFVVDATGRRRWFSSRQGMEKKVFDDLCGIVCFLSSKTPGDLDAMTLVEAVPDGWWYSALVPGNTRVVALFTDGILPIARSARMPIEWEKMMYTTDHIKLNIIKYDYRIVSGPHIMISNSSRLEKIVGDNWLAVGDAAATYDPISSKGIISAINDGINASDSIGKYLTGNSHILEDYSKNVITRFNSYLKKRSYYYKLENRWPDSEFWKKNQLLRITS
jgi:flavin-dependent dehydrogenase